jgi:hypothetical protein
MNPCAARCGSKSSIRPRPPFVMCDTYEFFGLIFIKIGERRRRNNRNFGSYCRSSSVKMAACIAWVGSRRQSHIVSELCLQRFRGHQLYIDHVEKSFYFGVFEFRNSRSINTTLNHGPT